MPVWPELAMRHLATDHNFGIPGQSRRREDLPTGFSVFMGAPPNPRLRMSAIILPFPEQLALAQYVEPFEKEYLALVTSADAGAGSSFGIVVEFKCRAK